MLTRSTHRERKKCQEKRQCEYAGRRCQSSEAGLIPCFDGMTLNYTSYGHCGSVPIGEQWMPLCAIHKLQ